MDYAINNSRRRPSDEADGVRQDETTTNEIHHSAVQELSDYLFWDSRRYDTVLKEGE